MDNAPFEPEIPHRIQEASQLIRRRHGLAPGRSTTRNDGVGNGAANAD
jgi:hypothetical protein